MIGVWVVLALFSLALAVHGVATGGSIRFWLPQLVLACVFAFLLAGAR